MRRQRAGSGPAPPVVRIRTSDLWRCRPALYPTELHRWGSRFRVRCAPRVTKPRYVFARPIVCIHAAAALLILLCFAAPVYAQPGTKMRHALHISIGCSMIATGIDYGVTMFALGGGKLREANSLLAPFSDNPAAFGAIKMGTAVGVNYLLLRMHEQHPKKSLAIGILSCATYSAVSIINTRRLDRVQGNR